MNSSWYYVERLNTNLLSLLLYRTPRSVADFVYNGLRTMAVLPFAYVLLAHFTLWVGRALARLVG